MNINKIENIYMAIKEFLIKSSLLQCSHSAPWPWILHSLEKKLQSPQSQYTVQE